MKLAEVDPERRAECALDDISIARRQWARQNRRPAALSTREALMVLEFEATFVWVAAANLANGEILSDADHDRLRLAQRRITAVVDEVNR